MRSVAEKMGIKPGVRTILVNGPDGIADAMHLPELAITSRISGMFGYIHLFVTKQADMRKRFPKLKKHLEQGGALWLSWPKGGQLDTDLSLPKVIEIGYDNGLVESKTLSVDSTWSAIKFTHPKDGKEYKNSYGRLKKS